MARLVKPLTDTQCTAAKPKDKEYSLFDGEGLILLVRPTGTKTWRYKYKWGLGTQIITLGTYPSIKLIQAREKKAEFEAMLANGIDPKQQLEEIKAKQENATSFEKITRLWHEEQTQKQAWGSDTGQKTLRKFENHLFPQIGKIPIEDIKTQHLAKAISTIDAKGINRTALDLKANLVRVFSYAIQHGYVEYNPARELDGLLIAKKQKHYPKLPYEKLPDFLHRIESYNGTLLTKLCILLTLHIFVRSSEVRFARWSEIDFKKKQWIIPPSREAVEGVRYSDRGAKMKENHLVPLSPQVIDILMQLKQISGQGDNLFPSRDDPNKFFSENTVNKALQRMGYDTTTDICGHGFRGMACGALIQSTLYSKDAVERQMSHKERNKVREAYTHTAEFLEERKSMMNYWSDYIDRSYNGFISPYDYGQQVKQVFVERNIVKLKITPITDKENPCKKDG